MLDYGKVRISAFGNQVCVEEKHIDGEPPLSPAKLSELMAALRAAVVDNLFPCYVCNQSVKLEEARTDERGRAVHETCYAKSLAEAFPD
jgi:hypothetical protein